MGSYGIMELNQLLFSQIYWIYFFQTLLQGSSTYLRSPNDSSKRLHLSLKATGEWYNSKSKRQPWYSPRIKSRACCSLPFPLETNWNVNCLWDTCFILHRLLAANFSERIIWYQLSPLSLSPRRAASLSTCSSEFAGSGKDRLPIQSSM